MNKWRFINHGGNPTSNADKKYAIFVGRFQPYHQGHISLIKKSKKKTNKTLVSIFNNRKQFNNKKDFQTYPRNNKKDLWILKKLNVDFVYLPNYKIIYNLKRKNKIIYLTEGENKLLIKLINKKNEIVLREELAEQDYDESELRKVDVQVTRLRQKIEKNPKQPHFLKTIRGKGYKLICNEL